MFFRNPVADAVVVLLILVLFFGPKRLPMLGRSIGEGIKEFKEGITSGPSDQEQLTDGGGSARETSDSARSRSA
jgi:sec-independent protein translocase protein TatA